MNSDSRYTARPALALAALTLIWGCNWVVMKAALFHAAPLDFAALRALLGAAGLFAVLALSGRRLAPIQWRSTLVLGLLQTAGFFGLVALALEGGAVGKSAVLAYTMPFWTLILAAVLLGERIRGLQWPAVALAAIGLVLILAPWSERLGASDSLYGLAAAVSWAASMMVVKRMRLRGGELLNVSAWQTLVGASALALLAVALPSEAMDWSATFLLALAYNAVLATAVAWLLWLFALSRLPAGITGLATLATPVVSVASAWLFFGETPAPVEALGMMLILSALGLLAMAGVLRNRRGTR